MGLIHDQLAVIFDQQRRTHTTLVFYRKHVAFFLKSGLFMLIENDDGSGVVNNRRRARVAKASVRR